MRPTRITTTEGHTSVTNALGDEGLLLVQNCGHCQVDDDLLLNQNLDRRTVDDALLLEENCDRRQSDDHLLLEQNRGDALLLEKPDRAVAYRCRGCATVVWKAALQTRLRLRLRAARR